MSKKDEEIRHLAGSAVKVTKDGERVLSDTLGPGERLASEVDAEAAEKDAKQSAERPARTERPTTTNAKSE